MFHLSMDNQRPAFILIPEPLGGWKKVKMVAKLGTSQRRSKNNPFGHDRVENYALRSSTVWQI